MRASFKHPQLYSDTIRFHKLYWRAHQNLPKAFRLTTGERILTEITACLGHVAAANFAGRADAEGRRAAEELLRLRERLEVIRALLTLAWELKFLSHHTMAALNADLDGLGKQASRWGQWFEGKGVSGTPY